MQLFITNKNYSSWSLRTWLALRQMNVQFQTRLVPMGATFDAELKAVSGAGRVPVLLGEHGAVWDSLSICEYVHERAGGGWPSEAGRRARARSIAAEIHSGFATLRHDWPLNLRLRTRREPSPALQAEIARIQQLLEGVEGPFLVGDFCIADAFLTATLLRLRSYGQLETCAYLDRLLTLPALQEWIRDAHAESEIVEKYEVR